MPTLHAERLKAKAEEKGDLNATAIARRLRTNRSTVARLLAGETSPSITSLLAIRRAYGISLDDLIVEDTGAGAS